MVNVYSPRLNKRKPSRFFLLLALFLFLFGGGNIYALIRALPNPTRITERSVVESTKIYDRTGKVLLYEIHGEEKRTVLPLREVPARVRQATLVAEDINFYHHPGLDWRGIGRAFIKNLVRGDVSQGGSTITQQLVKNSILTGERTFSRKLKEAILSLAIETKYSKDEIFELYLNQIPYGSNAYGVAAAAQTYFSKPVEELTLAEAATLAALPKAPTYYSPYGSHKEELANRTRRILERMAEAGFINAEELQSSKKERLSFAPPRQNIRAPHFVMYVREYLNKKYGDEVIEQGGLRVFTTLDWKLQEEAEKIVREGADNNEKLVQAANAALVAVDPRNGEILSMVGSRDFLANSYPEGCTPGKNCRFDPHVNVAVRPRQPGSAFKPFVYATAFKKGYTPETVLFDVPTEFNPNCNLEGTPGPLIKDPKDCYHPQNYDQTFRGPVTMRQALAQSLNVPSVKVLYLAGIKDSIETARTLGITTLTDPDRYGLSLVLGGAEVTLLEMTSAFGTFSQEGTLHPYTALLRVEDSKGFLLEEKKDLALPVLDTEMARTINNVLSDNDARVPVFNPRSSLYFSGRQVAAKTGTTQDFRDAWVIGYTPSLVAGVWVGNNDNTPMNQSGLSVMVAGPIWHRFLEFTLSSSPPESFVSPALHTTEKPVLRGLYRTGPVVKIDKISRKLATAYTPAELIEEVSFGPASSILAFVKKDEPAGPPPANPQEDPQFKNWEGGIDKWLERNKLSDAGPPKDFDTLHTPQTQPKLEFTYPPPGLEKISSPLRSINLNLKAVFPLQEVSLFINDELRASHTAPLLSSTINFTLSEPLEEGSWQIKITAYDTVGNKGVMERTLNIGR